MQNTFVVIREGERGELHTGLVLVLQLQTAVCFENLYNERSI